MSLMQGAGLQIDQLSLQEPVLQEPALVALDSPHPHLSLVTASSTQTLENDASGTETIGSDASGTLSSTAQLQAKFRATLGEILKHGRVLARNSSTLPVVLVVLLVVFIFSCMLAVMVRRGGNDDRKLLSEGNRYSAPPPHWGRPSSLHASSYMAPVVPITRTNLSLPPRSRLPSRISLPSYQVGSKQASRVSLPSHQGNWQASRVSLPSHDMNRSYAGQVPLTVTALQMHDSAIGSSPSLGFSPQPEDDPEATPAMPKALPPALCAAMVLPLCEVRFGIALDELLNLKTQDCLRIMGISGNTLLRAKIQQVHIGFALEILMPEASSPPCAHLQPSLHDPEVFEISGYKGTKYGMLHAHSGSECYVTTQGKIALTLNGDFERYQLWLRTEDGQSLATVKPVRDQFADGGEHLEIRVDPGVDSVLVLASALTLLLLSPHHRVR